MIGLARLSAILLCVVAHFKGSCGTCGYQHAYFVIWIFGIIRVLVEGSEESMACQARHIIFISCSSIYSSINTKSPSSHSEPFLASDSPPSRQRHVTRINTLPPAESEAQRPSSRQDETQPDKVRVLPRPRLLTLHRMSAIHALISARRICFLHFVCRPFQLLHRLIAR
jgi:hypothetical protein